MKCPYCEHELPVDCSTSYIRCPQCGCDYDVRCIGMLWGDEGEKPKIELEFEPHDPEDNSQN